MNRQRDTLRGLAGGIFLGFFLIGLAFALFFGLGHYFLTLLFVGLACSSVLGMMSTFEPKKIYGGLQSFLWFLGLAILFLPQIPMWPWTVGGFLIVCGISLIVGALAKPIIARIEDMGILGVASRAPQQPDEPEQQPYEQGYQPQAQGPGSQTGGQIYYHPPQPQPLDEQPQVQYPQGQELPLQY